MPRQKTTVIGWKESIHLIDWGIENLVAKSDTGALRSALDVKNIVELPDKKVKFDIALERKKRNLTRTVIASISHQTHVRSSNGQQHERYFVTTNIQIGNRIKEIELSLVCRKNMTCRMLIGRKALEGDFLVDSAATFLTGRPQKLTLIKTDIET